MKKTLGLTGVTVNAMALIAPGAFLWLTFQLQAANTDASGASTAPDMWTGIVAALDRRVPDGDFFRRTGAPLSRCGHGQRLLLRRESISRSQRAVAPPLGAHRQVHHRLGRAPVLLGLSGRDGRLHGDAVDVYRQPVWHHYSAAGTGGDRVGVCGTWSASSPCAASAARPRPAL